MQSTMEKANSIGCIASIYPNVIVKYCSLQSQCEMKFAHIRVSEYFTFAEQIFHSEAISHAERISLAERRIPLKKTHISLVDKCVFFLRKSDQKVRKVG